MDQITGDFPLCSELSIEGGEPLIATATPTSTYLLVEYNGAWGEKALEESDIPAALRSKLKGYSQSIPECKVQLIRSTRSLLQPGIRFLAARRRDRGGAPPGGVIYDFHFAQYEDLLELDIPAILGGDAAYDRYRRKAPVYLVCTNGRRDRCCARYGTAVFNALLEETRQDPDFAVWQCSHIGGHRFAANLIYLPAGVLYGRVRAETVPAILEAGRQDRVYLPNLRGRMSYPPAAQAAEAALRRELKETRLEALRLESAEQTEPGNWEVMFNGGDGQRYPLQVTVRQTDRTVYESCLLEKTAPIMEYAVTGPGGWRWTG